MNPYVLKVGRAGEQRLHLLNETCNAATLSFFHDTVNLEGKSILDIGCGTGILACELALKVGKKGFVNALDISQDQLMLARKNAHLKNISNIILTQLSAHEINLLTDKYDIIYCRFVMTHLRNADSIINKMKSLLHPDGLIIIEEPADIDCMSAYPPSTILKDGNKLALLKSEFNKQILLLVVKFRIFLRKIILRQSRLIPSNLY